jgi:hypothetical protein
MEQPTHFQFIDFGGASPERRMGGCGVTFQWDLVLSMAQCCICGIGTSIGRVRYARQTTGGFGVGNL